MNKQQLFENIKKKQSTVIRKHQEETVIPLRGT